MPIVPAGSVNLNSIGVPNVIVQIQPPNPLLNGVPTRVVGAVGIASYGPVNSPWRGSFQEYTQVFGLPLPVKYDLGTQIFNASQQGGNDFVCVRVTDGTDTKAFASLLDENSAVGVLLYAKYTGEFGNYQQNVSGLQAVISNGSTASTYKLTVYFLGGIPEVFDNIGGSGNDFWVNLANAVNLGQNNLRGPSQIITATTGNDITSVTVSASGSYETMPTLSASIGTGAVLNPVMKAVSGVTSARGTGYSAADTITLTGGVHSANAVLTVNNVALVSVSLDTAGANYNPGDTIVLAGGTFTAAAVVTVDTVDTGGEILTFHLSTLGAYTVKPSSFTQGSTSGIGSGATFDTGVWGVNTVSVSTPGSYSTLPSSPVAQGSTSGAGSGATFTMMWGLLSVVVSNGGVGYTSQSVFSVSGGGGSGAFGTLNLGGASGAPEVTTYNFSGGTNGNAGVSDATLIGSDVFPRTGMYALRGTQASIGLLADQTDPTLWSYQESFGLSEGLYMIATLAKGGFVDLNAQVTLKRSSNVADYPLKAMVGDWVLFNDPFNSIRRYASPQGFVAGVMSAQLPSDSSLNKPMRGIIATEKTETKQVYSDADLLFLQTNGLDVITSPIPLSPNAPVFGVRLGVNTSSNITQNGDNYTRMVNFLSETFETGLGLFIGLPQTPDEQRSARNTLQFFLRNLKSLGMVSDFNVILDDSNNPPNRVALGYMQANVSVRLTSIILQFVINLEAGQSVQVTPLPPQLAA